MGTYFNFVPNYTGPYISNGGFQESVIFGEVAPKDELDAASRLHDTAYAKWNDQLHRTVADIIYNETVRELDGFSAAMARGLVLYGNATARAVNKIVGYLHLGPLGLVAGAVDNGVEVQKLLSMGDEVHREILDFYSTDPYPQYQLGRSKRMGNTPTQPSASKVYADLPKSDPARNINLRGSAKSTASIYNPSEPINAKPYVNMKGSYNETPADTGFSTRTETASQTAKQRARPEALDTGGTPCSACGFEPVSGGAYNPGYMENMPFTNFLSYNSLKYSRKRRNKYRRRKTLERGVDDAEITRLYGRR